MRLADQGSRSTSRQHRRAGGSARPYGVRVWGSAVGQALSGPPLCLLGTAPPGQGSKTTGLRPYRDDMAARPAEGAKGTPGTRAPVSGRCLLTRGCKGGGARGSIGGWAPKKDKDGVIDPALSPWFYVQLTRENAPWAFVRGLPARTISTLELFATTVGLVLLAPPELDCPGASGLVSVTGLTDSQVSANVVARGLTTSYPLCTMAMELAAQLEARGAELHLEWIPRAMNKEADALADGRTEGFDPSRRVSADVRNIEWLVLDRLLASGEAFHRDANRIRERRKNKTREAETGGGGKRQKLREREPW